MNRSNEGVGMVLIVAAIFITVAYGWIMNILALVGMNWDAAIGIEGALRIVGVLVVPLGVVMGIFV